MALLQYRQTFVSTTAVFSAQEWKMQLVPLTQSKTPQKNGLYDYPAHYEGNRQECKFVFNAPQDKHG
jgi:hypothetical protein